MASSRRSWIGLVGTTAAYQSSVRETEPWVLPILFGMTSFPAPADGRDFDWGPQRTSILAILALVFALPCFIPGVGFIASLLAVFALVGIASS